MLRFWCVLVLLMLMPPAAQAQDDLSDEQVALLERLFEAIDNADNYTSYLETKTIFNTQTIEIDIPESANLSISRAATQTMTATTVAGDVAAFATVTVTTQDFENPITYTLNADIRYVADVLYVQASYAVPNPDLPTLPSDWIVVDDPAMFPDLDLETFFDHQDQTEDSSLRDLLFSDRTRLNQIVSDISILSGIGPDGEAVDLITLSLDFLTVFEEGLGFPVDVEGVDPGVLLTLLTSSDITFSATFTLRPGDQISGSELILAVNTPDMDLAALSGDANIPPDTTFALRLNRVESSSISRINDDTLPTIEAPE